MAGLGGLGGKLGGGLGGGLGGMGGGQDFDQLKTKYWGFTYPQIMLKFGGKEFYFKHGEIVNDLRIEQTSGFEASIARFRIFGVYNMYTGEFEYDNIKKKIMLGNSMEILMGYQGIVSTVFVGFVAQVNFRYDGYDLPYVEVTGMDIKGIMMSGSYATRLQATNYGDAVKEILRRTTYTKLQSSQGMTSAKVSATPDKKPGAGKKGASDKSIEMVGESDYEFVVKAAKRFNFEFFTDRGTVYFRPAKQDESVLMKLGIGKGIYEFDIGYSLVGLVGKFETRAVNAGTGKLIKAKGKAKEKISLGSKAKGLVKGSQKVYVDSTITSQEDADARLQYQMEQAKYDLGSIECVCQGLPELSAGHFIEIEGMGAPVDNKFYLTNVVHELTQEKGYQTIITGKACEVKKKAPGGGMGLPL